MKKFVLVVFGTLALSILCINQVQSYSGDAPEVLIALVKNSPLPTCNSCHGTGETGIIAETGGLQLIKEDSQFYDAGLKFDMTLKLDSAKLRHGFQFIALDENNNSVGSLTSTSALVKIDNDAVYSVSHASHNQIGGGNPPQFEFSWTGPTSYKGPITFHMIAVAANGDRNNTGDHVYYQTLKLTYDETLSLSKIIDEQFRVYPNPSSDEITIEIFNDQFEEYSISNLDGQLLHEERLQGRTVFVLEHLPKGTYLLVLKGHEDFAVKKIISK